MSRDETIRAALMSQVNPVASNGPMSAANCGFRSLAAKFLELVQPAQHEADLIDEVLGWVRAQSNRSPTFICVPATPGICNLSAERRTSCWRYVPSVGIR